MLLLPTLIGVESSGRLGMRWSRAGLEVLFPVRSLIVFLAFSGA